MKWNGRRLVVCGELWCFDQRWIQPKNCKPFTWWFMEKLKQQTFCCRQRDVMNGVVYARRVRDEQQPIYLIILQMKETDENHGTRRRWALMDWSTSYGVNLEVWPLTTHVPAVRSFCIRLFDREFSQNTLNSENRCLKHEEKKRKEKKRKPVLTSLASIAITYMKAATYPQADYFLWWMTGGQNSD